MSLSTGRKVSFTAKMIGFIPFLILSAGICNGNLMKISNFNDYSHGVKGEVFIKNRTTLVVKNFEFDGACPDAYFWVGTTPKVGAVGTVLPYSFKGRHQQENLSILKGKSNTLE